MIHGGIRLRLSMCQMIDRLRPLCWRLCVASLFTMSLNQAVVVAEQLPIVEPSVCGLDETRLMAMEPLITEAIDSERMPGCVVCIGRRGKIAWLKAYGDKQLLPTSEPMTIDTVFDMASLTKPMATATSVMCLLDDRKVDLTDAVVEYFPTFGSHGKEKITVLDLLLHRSGLTPDNALSDYDKGPEVAWERICGLSLIHSVGTEFKYSDVNFIVLGKLVERLSGKDLNDYSREKIFEPLMMHSTGFLPDESHRKKAAPTEKRDGEWMKGTVHDPRAYALGGIAGHAGLFSTAEDVAVYAQMLLGRGEYPIRSDESVRILTAAVVDRMTSSYEVLGGIRGLGWDKQSGYSSNRGKRMSSAAFGHGGFTGTVLWVDPENELFVIFLSNRVHPDGKGSINSLAGSIVDMVVGSL